MKKILMILIIAIMTLESISSKSPIRVQRQDDKPFEESTYIDISMWYDKEKYYRFMFSDLNVDIKDGNFEYIFDTPPLEWITLDVLKDDHLYSDKKVYVYWQVDEQTRISKVEIELPGPLRKQDGAYLDWYVSVGDDSNPIGGKNGYGPGNTRNIYERDISLPLEEYKDSVLLNIWTDDITGKKSGNYVGYLVLRVYGEH